MRTQFRGVTGAMMDELTDSVSIFAADPKYASFRSFLSLKGFDPRRVVIVDIIPEQECEVITVAAGGYVVRFDLARDDKTASDFVLYELRKFVNNGSRGKSLRSRVRAAVSILNNLQLP